MSESTEKEDGNKSSEGDTAPTVTPPPTVLKKSPALPSDSVKKKIQFFPSQFNKTHHPHHPHHPSSYARLDDDQRIPIVDIGDDEIDVRGEKIKNGKRFGPLIIWQINALCNFIMLFGCGILLYFYFKSSEQSDYVFIAKTDILAFLVIELIVRVVNLLQMRYYDSSFSLGDGLGILLIKKESYLVFSSEWIEMSQIIKLADTADNTCFMIPTLLFLHIITCYLVYRQDPTDTSCAVDDICKIVETILSIPAMILVITRIWFIIKTIDYARKVDDDDNDDDDFDDVDGDGDYCCCECFN